MKIYILICVIFSCSWSTSQNLSVVDKARLKEVIAEFKALESDPYPKEWFLFETSDERSMFFDKQGQLQLNLENRFEWVEAFYGAQLARVSRNSRIGFINRNGKVVIPFDFENAKVFSNGLAAVMMLDKHGFIDMTGKLIIPAIYEDAKYFGNGLAPIKKNGKYGFINRKGEIVIPCIYQDANSFHNNRAAVQLVEYQNNKKNEAGKWGFINTKGKLVIPNTYSKVEHFKFNGTAKVSVYLNNDTTDVYYIDKDGNRI